MSTINIPAVKPYHIVCFEGKLRTIGKGNASFRPGIDEIFWFATEQERDADARVVADRTQRNILKETITQVVLPKSTQAYSAMRQDALDWLRAEKAGNAVWDPELYPALAITVEECNKTPTEAAISINQAVKLNILDPERTRTKTREHLRTLGDNT